MGEIRRADIPAQTGCDIIQDNAGRITAVILNGTRHSPEALSALAAAVERARPLVAAALAWRAADRAWNAFLTDAATLNELSGGDDLDQAVSDAEAALAAAVDAYAGSPEGAAYAAERAAAQEAP